MHTSSSVFVATSPTQPSAPPSLWKDHICFITDTDSRSYIIDTWTNRVIVDDSTLLKGINIGTSQGKGISGTKVKISRTGNLSIPLKYDDGHFDLLPNMDAVLVPSSPYNLLPPRLLITHMRSSGYIIHHFKHNDANHAFRYKKVSISSSTACTITVPINANGLFQFWTYDVYTFCMSRVSHYCKEFLTFTGAAHDIPSEDEDSSPSYI